MFTKSERPPASRAGCAMNSRMTRLLALGLVAFIGLGALTAARLVGTSCGPLARSPCVRVLFIGNSYTFVNDLPTVFRDLARAAGHEVDTSIVANGGGTLGGGAASQESGRATPRPPWTFVALYEQSQIPAI